VAMPLTFLVQICLKSEVAGGATHEPFGHIFTGGFAKREKRHKRYIPAAGLARIRAANRARWAKVRAAKN
jgi:hypothetical protein